MMLKNIMISESKGVKGRKKRIVICFKNAHELKMNKIMFSGLGGGWRGADLEKTFSKRSIPI